MLETVCGYGTFCGMYIFEQFKTKLLYGCMWRPWTWSRSV